MEKANHARFLCTIPAQSTMPSMRIGTMAAWSPVTTGTPKADDEASRYVKKSSLLAKPSMVPAIVGDAAKAATEAAATTGALCLTRTRRAPGRAATTPATKVASGPTMEEIMG